jgi:predicted phosphodiesterase
MALYGLIAGIQGNREALSAALEALERHGADRVVCLGDVVGYNADPEECVALVRGRCASAIAGNDDLIGVRQLDFRGCSTKAEYSLRRTRRALSPESRAWLAALPAVRILQEGVILVHGGVRDVEQPMASTEHIRENAQLLREDFPGARLCFYGHGHEQKVYRVEGNEAVELPGDRHSLEENHLYFVSPGSVDASRKRGPRLAECALFDSFDRTIDFLRVPYDGAATEAKAIVFGYRINPLTDRLYTLRRRTASAARRIGERLTRAAHTGR